MSVFTTLTLKSGLNDLTGNTYNLSSVLEIPSNCSMKGGLVNNPSGPNGYSYHINGQNTITVDGTVFNGGGLYIEGNNVHDITINNNEFHLNASGDKKCGIEFEAFINNLTITNNLFTGYNGGGFGIFSYVGYNNIKISNNEFVNISAGVHIDATNPSSNLLFEQNYFIGMKGMGLEIQDNVKGVIVQDNWFEHPTLSTNHASNGNSMAYSCPLDKSSNVVIQRNVVIAPERPDGIGLVIGIECGGDNTTVTQNYMNGVNQSILCSDGTGTCSVTATYNHIENALQGAGQANGAPGRTFTNNNNGSSVQLNWDVNRGRPYRNKRYGDPTPTPVPPTPIPPVNTYVKVPLPSGTYTFISDMNFTTVKNGWGPVEKDRSNGEAATADGNPIRIATNEYSKGLGCHASSQVNIGLNANYDTFQSDIGLDEEVANNGSVIFQVLGDGKELYNSGTIIGSDVPKTISVSVKGVKLLSLIINSSNSSLDFDHADWAFPRVTPITKKVVMVTDKINYLDGTSSTVTAITTDTTKTTGSVDISLVYNDGTSLIQNIKVT